MQLGGYRRFGPSNCTSSSRSAGCGLWYVYSPCVFYYFLRMSGSEGWDCTRWRIDRPWIWMRRRVGRICPSRNAANRETNGNGGHARDCSRYDPVLHSHAKAISLLHAGIVENIPATE